MPNDVILGSVFFWGVIVLGVAVLKLFGTYSGNEVLNNSTIQY